MKPEVIAEHVNHTLRRIYGQPMAENDIRIDDDEHRERMEMVNYPCQCSRCVLPDGTRVESLYAKRAKARDQGTMLAAKPPVVQMLTRGFPSLAELAELDCVP